MDGPRGKHLLELYLSFWSSWEVLAMWLHPSWGPVCLLISVIQGLAQCLAHLRLSINASWVAEWINSPWVPHLGPEMLGWQADASYNFMRRITMNAQQRSEYNLWGWVQNFINKTLKEIKEVREPVFAENLASLPGIVLGVSHVLPLNPHDSPSDREPSSQLLPLTSDKVFSNTDATKDSSFSSHSRSYFTSCKPAAVWDPSQWELR